MQNVNILVENFNFLKKYYKKQTQNKKPTMTIFIAEKVYQKQSTPRHLQI